MERNVAIVGAGLSGVLACKYALSKGYRPVVFESQSKLGGVWANYTMEITRLQTPKMVFQFSDFPWPSSVADMNPPAHQVLEYIKSYADHFGVLKHIRFNTKVVSIQFEGASDQEIHDWSLWNGTGEGFGNKGKWTLLLHDIATQSEQVMQFDFVILCVGRFSELPVIPEFPEGKGQEVFRGKVLHTKDYSAMDNKDARSLVKGKRVVVIGSQKSALEVASECALANGKENPCHLIYRTPHWYYLDRFTQTTFPLAHIYFHRFAELLLHKPGEGLFLFLLATILSPLRWLLNQVVETYLKHKHPLKKLGVVPKYSVLEAISSCQFPIIPDGFYKYAEEGSIVMKKAQKFSFCEQGVVLEGEEKPLKADVVIFATGYHGDQKIRNIFASSKFQDYIMGSPTSIVPLYRQCIHPRIPQLAVIGFSASLTNLFTSEMRSRWVMELLDGTFKLPEIKEMDKDISRWDKFLKTYAPNNYRKACLGLVHIWYNDQLCKDMGWNPKRKSGLFSELFEPYGPQDYINPF